MKRPMIYWVILFVLGEVLGYYFTISQMVIVITGMSGLVFIIAAIYRLINKKSSCCFRMQVFQKHWVLWAGIFFVLFGMMNMMTVKEKIRFCQSLKNTPVELSGVVIRRQEKENKIQYVVRSDFLKERRYHVHIVVSVPETELMPGERIWLEGKAVSFEKAVNPGGYDEESYQYGNGNYLKVEDANVTKKYRSSFCMRYTLFGLQQKLLRVYREVLDEKNASLAGAMVLGDKANLDADVKEMYQKNGIAHLIAISGLHIAMIGGTLYQLLRKLLGSYGLSALIGGSFIVLYGIMTGLSGATLRAVIMLILMMGAEVSGRRYDIITAIAVALLVMLIMNPYQMFQAGFLLSFGAILGITWLVPVWKQYFKKAPKWLDGLGVSVSVQIMTFPVMLWFFYEIPVWGFLLNLLVVPLMSILLVCLILCGVSGLFFLQAAGMLALPARWIFGIYEWLCRISEAVPIHTLCMGRPSPVFVFLYYGLLVCFLWTQYEKGIFYQKRFAGLEGRKIAAAFYFVAVVFLLILQKIPGNLKVCMLDVGQGDGIYIRTPEQIHILMDGGSSTKRKTGKYILENAAKYYGASGLDYVFVSHSDSDHYSGILELLQDGEMEIQYLVLPAVTNPDEAYKELEQQAGKAGTKVIYMQEGDCIQMGKVSLKCLNPKYTSYEDKNTGSLVFLLTYQEFDMLFTGDMDKEVEQRLLGKDVFSKTQVEVLKVAHHGSNTASSEEFLSSVFPETALVSVGVKNRYGHPAKEVMKRLSRFSQKIYLTKDCGAVTIDTDGRQYRIETYLSKRQE